MQNHVLLNPSDLSALRNEVMGLLANPHWDYLVDMEPAKQEEILRDAFGRQQDAANTVDDRTYAAMWCLQRCWDARYGVKEDILLLPVRSRREFSHEPSQAFRREYQDND